MGEPSLGHNIFRIRTSYYKKKSRAEQSTSERFISYSLLLPKPEQRVCNTTYEAASWTKNRIDAFAMSLQATDISILYLPTAAVVLHLVWGRFAREWLPVAVCKFPVERAQRLLLQREDAAESGKSWKTVNSKQYLKPYNPGQIALGHHCTGLPYQKCWPETWRHLTIGKLGHWILNQGLEKQKLIWKCKIVCLNWPRCYVSL